MSRESEYNRKYYNDVVLYKTIAQIDRIILLGGSKRSNALSLLKHLSDFYSEIFEFEKMYFMNQMLDYMKLNYQESFEETYLLREESNFIKNQLEDEYGGNLH